MLESARSFRLLATVIALAAVLLHTAPAWAQVLPPAAVGNSGFVTVVNPSGTACGAGDTLNSLCYDIEVSCDASIVHPVTGAALPMRTATVKVSWPTTLTAAGHVLFTTGGYGKGLYSYSIDPNPQVGARGTVVAMRDAGFITFELGWSGADGWVTGGEGFGFSKLMCGPLMVLDWLQNASGLSVANTLTCGTGNSGGAMQIASMLAVPSPVAVQADYDAATKKGLHTVVYSGGPSFSRQDGVCFDAQYDPVTDTGTGISMAHMGRGLIDKMQGWSGVGGPNYCGNAVVPPALELKKMLGSQLISVPLWGDATYVETRDYDTVTRQLTVVGGGNDGTGAPLFPRGNDITGAHKHAEFYNQRLVGVNASALFLQGMNLAITTAHEVHNTTPGAAKIRALLLNHCQVP